MNQHTIDEMLDVLRPVVKDRKKANEILQRFWKNRIAIVWELEDVFRSANEREVAITKAQGRDILQDLLRNHNAQYGLRWSDITQIIEDDVMGRKLTKQELSRFIHHDIIAIDRAKKRKR